MLLSADGARLLREARHLDLRGTLGRREDLQPLQQQFVADVEAQDQRQARTGRDIARLESAAPR